MWQESSQLAIFNLLTTLTISIDAVFRHLDPDASVVMQLGVNQVPVTEADIDFLRGRPLTNLQLLSDWSKLLDGSQPLCPYYDKQFTVIC